MKRGKFIRASCRRTRTSAGSDADFCDRRCYVRCCQVHNMLISPTMALSDGMLSRRVGKKFKSAICKPETEKKKKKTVDQLRTEELNFHRIPQH